MSGSNLLPRSFATVTLVGLALHAAPLSAQPRRPPQPPPAADPPPAAQSPGSSATDALRQHEARQHFQTGTRHYQAGEYSQAIEEFQTAYRLFPSPTILFNMAQAYRADGQLARAIETFRRYLEDNARLTPQQRQEVEEVITEIERSRAVLSFEVEPAGATVILDGRPLGTSPLPRGMELLPGEHQIEVRLEDHETVRDTVLVRSHDQRLFQATLRPVERNARLVVNAQPDTARILVDGREVGHGSINERLRPGAHDVSVSADGYVTHSQRVEIGVLRTERLSVDLVRPRRSIFTRPVFWIAVGAAVGIAAVTIIALNPSVPDPIPGNGNPSVIQAITW